MASGCYGVLDGLASPSMSRPPSVDALARSLAASGLPHPLLVDVARQSIADGAVEDAAARAEALRRTLLTPVVNATGVLLHTNLGRAPVSLAQTARAESLELDLATGERGSRQRGIGSLLARLCGGESAMVVNNNAAAVLLVLAALADGRDVPVSRGESVEIGGGFRVPDVMEQSGAHLVDVGTTNRTRLADYRRAITRPGADVALVLKVHRSNFRLDGFVEETTVAELATLGPPVVADLGSGLVDATCPWLPGPPPKWLAEEPATRQTLAAGAALVTFSGDKLFGGPQAGVIVGQAELIERCGKHPLARRCARAVSCSSRCSSWRWRTSPGTSSTSRRSGGWRRHRWRSSPTAPTPSLRRQARSGWRPRRSPAQDRHPARRSRRLAWLSTVTGSPRCGRTIHR